MRNKWNSKLHFSPPLSNIVFVHGTGNIRRSFFPPTYMQRKSHSSPAVRSPFKLLNTSVNFRIISIAILCSALLLSTINKKERRFSPFRISKEQKMLRCFYIFLNLEKYKRNELYTSSYGFGNKLSQKKNIWKGSTLGNEIYKRKIENEQKMEGKRNENTNFYNKCFLAM